MSGFRRRLIGRSSRGRRGSGGVFVSWAELVISNSNLTAEFAAFGSEAQARREDAETDAEKKSKLISCFLCDLRGLCGEILGWNADGSR
jgi:hypothetical protein